MFNTTNNLGSSAVLGGEKKKKESSSVTHRLVELNLCFFDARELQGSDQVHRMNHCPFGTTL